MSKRIKKSVPNIVKYITLILVIILLVIAFKKTKQRKELNTSSLNNNESLPVSVSLENNVSSNNINTEIIGQTDNMEFEQYILNDQYIILSDETKYYNSGYKYFIIGTTDMFKKYISTHIQSPFERTYVSPYTETNNIEIQKVSSIINTDFFKTNRLIFLVDYSKDSHGGAIDSIIIDDSKAIININRTINTERTSKYNIFIVPINTLNVHSVYVTYTK